MNHSNCITIKISIIPLNYLLLTFKDVVQIEDSWSRQTREQAATEARLHQENAQLKTSLTQKDMAIKGKYNKKNPSLATGVQWEHEN